MKNKFDRLFNEIILEMKDDEMVTEGIGKTLATFGAIGTILAGGGINNVEAKPINNSFTKVTNTSKNNAENLIDFAGNFIKLKEGTVKNKDGMHVVYDDARSSHFWNGKQDLNEFLNSCIGNPTIGYGETSSSIVKKGMISDSDAIKYMEKNIVRLNNSLVHQLGIAYTRLNRNQKTALISLYYNLGDDLSKTPKLVQALKDKRYNDAAKEFLDCNKKTVNGKKVPDRGLTNRRIAESKLFLTPVK